MVLIILVNFSLLIISSYTYIVTRVSNMLLYFITFTPTIFAIAEPLKRFATCQKKILYVKLFSLRKINKSLNKSVLIIINNKSINKTLYNYCIYIYIYIYIYMLYMCVIYIVIYYTNIVILYNYIIIYV